MRCLLRLAIVFVLLASSPLRAQDESFAGKKPGQEWAGNSLKMKFCWCPPGKFKMGEGSDQVEVTLTRGFWMGKTEVTQAQWKSVMDQQPWKGFRFVKVGKDFPVTFVSWENAMNFCAELTKKERKPLRLPVEWEFRLPTEAQWEYACRSGSKTTYSFGDDVSRLGDYAWFVDNADLLGDKYAHRVGLKKPNRWGLHDMHGNVWEWCRDWYQKELPGGKDPEATKMAKSRVFRGGSWDYEGRSCRSAIRAKNKSGLRERYLGFRVALVQVSK